MPLFDAPKGWWWLYDEPDGPAHLYPEGNEPSACGTDIRGDRCSKQVGGCSQKPCLKCIARVWKDRVAGK